MKKKRTRQSSAEGRQRQIEGTKRYWASKKLTEVATPAEPGAILVQDKQLIWLKRVGVIWGHPVYKAVK